MTESELPIMVLFCGGSISSAKNPNSNGADAVYGVEDLLGRCEKAVNEYGPLQSTEICRIDSTDLSPKNWESLVDEIESGYNLYSAWVITVGTNTMAYVSSALSFALRGIGKPVILTGSQIPLDQTYSDGHSNFTNACRIARMDLAGIYVVFASKIILGCRAKKTTESELDAFCSFNDSDIGEIGVFTLFDSTNEQCPRRHSNPFKPVNGFESKISCLTLVPGIESEIIHTIVDSGIKGIVLRAFGTGDIPEALFEGLEYARDCKVPIVVTTQCPNGVTSIGVNHIGHDALARGVIEVFDMSMESMTTKLMWLLKKGVEYDEFKTEMQNNLVGEIRKRELESRENL